MPASAHLLVVAGDPSGDRHAASLVTELRRQKPALRVTAMGGRFLQRVADRFLFPLVELGGFGFWEPVLQLPSLWKAYALLQHLLQEDPPDAVIPTDYYGFNIRVAGSARRRRIPVYYYISPQVWASRPWRMHRLKAAVTRMMVLFPFEEALYTQAGIPATFVGHPLVDLLPSPAEQASPRTIGFLPGSRRSVVQRHLPLVEQTARRLLAHDPGLKLVLFRPPEIEEAFYAPLANVCPALKITLDESYEERRRLSFAFTVSGTAALENMLLGIPMVIFYQLSALTYAIARRLATVSAIGIPNLLAQRLVVPECIQRSCTPDRLMEAAEPMLSDPQRWSAVRAELLALRHSLDPARATPPATVVLGGLSA